ncbi:hypothetical protein [Clostridium sp. CTA-1]
MLEVAYLGEKEILKAIPQEVQETILGILQILDIGYGANRNKYEDDGGYVIIARKKEDFREIKAKTYIDYKNVIVEYIDKIECRGSKIYTNSSILCNNEYAISIIIPLALTP